MPLGVVCFASLAEVAPGVSDGFSKTAERNRPLRFRMWKVITLLVHARQESRHFLTAVGAVLFLLAVIFTETIPEVLSTENDVERQAHMRVRTIRIAATKGKRGVKVDFNDS